MGNKVCVVVVGSTIAEQKHDTIQMACQSRTKFRGVIGSKWQFSWKLPAQA